VAAVRSSPRSLSRQPAETPCGGLPAGPARGKPSGHPSPSSWVPRRLPPAPCFPCPSRPTRRARFAGS